MPQLLARMARTLSSHWKRSLAAAVGVLVLLVLAAGASGEATDDYCRAGDRFAAGDRPLPGALAGVRRGGLDACLHRGRGQGLRSGLQGGDRGGARGGPRARRRRAGGEPVRARRPGLRGRAPGLRRRALLHRPRADREGRRRRADRGRRDRRARGSGRGARHAHRPGVRAGRSRRRADRRAHRDRAADRVVPLGVGDGRDAHRRTARCRGGPDPACRAGRSARPALVRGCDRGDARPRRGDRLLVADHGPLPRAAGGRRQRPGCGRACGFDLRHHGRGRGTDRDGGDRRPAA